MKNVKIECFKGREVENPEYSLKDLGFKYDIHSSDNCEDKMIEQFVYLINLTFAKRMGDLHRYFGIRNGRLYSHYFKEAVNRILDDIDFETINTLDDYFAYKIYDLLQDHVTVQSLYYGTCLTHKMINEVIFENKYDFDYSFVNGLFIEKAIYKDTSLYYKKRVKIGDYEYDYVFYDIETNKILFALEYKYNDIIYSYAHNLFLNHSDIYKIINDFDNFDYQKWLQTFEDKLNNASKHNIPYIIFDDLVEYIAEDIQYLCASDAHAQNYMKNHIQYVSSLQSKMDFEIEEPDYYLCDVHIEEDNHNLCYLSRDGMIDPLTRVNVPIKNKIYTGLVLSCQKCKKSDLPFPLDKMKYIHSVISILDHEFELTYDYNIRHEFEHVLLPGIFYTHTEIFIKDVLENDHFLSTLYIDLYHQKNLYNVVHSDAYHREMIEIFDDLKAIKIQCPYPDKRPLSHNILLIYNDDYTCIQYFILEKGLEIPVLCSWDEHAKHISYISCPEEEEIFINACVDIFIQEHSSKDPKEEHMMN